LEAHTQEKLYIVAGPEFVSRGGNTLIIHKEINGLNSSGLCWWEWCSEILLSMGFHPSKVEDDLWMKRVSNVYEYIARYVDDLAIGSKEPVAILENLTTQHQLKLKGSGPISYHLRADFFHDKKGKLCMAAKKYID